MSEKNRFSKPVAFNTKNEKDQVILKYVKRRNFSGFAKKAMLEYIEREEQKKKESQKSIQVKEEKSSLVIESLSEETEGPVIEKNNFPTEEPKRETAVEKMKRIQEKIKQQMNTPPQPKTYVNRPKD